MTPWRPPAPPPRVPSRNGRLAALTADLGITDGQLAETAVRFVLSAPAVSTVIPGMRSVRNAAAGDGVPLTGERLKAPAGHRWERNFHS
ncbi:hypothetical protein [Kitasatospora phosalacinea]|uniref:hypothetical protein n=1 Tax=Kitasatospora phosalacinea TaxID=2065 RepID=UPI0005252C9A|nr:hypothetical protein [Kitasatospora phosalacinea]